MAKASIHIIPVKTTSEIHNKRLKDYDYVRKDLSHKNESWEIESISNARKRIEENYQKNTGQKMQKKATPVREGVVNLNPEHTMQDLFRLKEELERKLGIKTIQIHIHRDEGHYRSRASSKDWKPNLHAHMVFDWTDEKGKSLKLNRYKMSDLQDIVSETLSMERGQKANITGIKHLNPVEYKIQKITENIKEKSQELEEQLQELEKLKNIYAVGEKELKEINSELEQKRLKFQQFFKNGINVGDFVKSVPNGFFGTKKEINEEEIKNLIQSFSFSTEENKKLQEKVQELEVLQKEKDIKIKTNELEIKELMKLISLKNEQINNPSDSYLTQKRYEYDLKEKEIFKNKVKEIENEINRNFLSLSKEINLDGLYREKLGGISNKKTIWELMEKHYPGGQSKFEEDTQNQLNKLIENHKTLKGIVSLSIRMAIAENQGGRLTLEDITDETYGTFQRILKQNKITNVWNYSQIEDEIYNQADNLEINLRYGGVRIR